MFFFLKAVDLGSNLCVAVAWDYKTLVTAGQSPSHVTKSMSSRLEFLTLIHVSFSIFNETVPFQADEEISMYRVRVYVLQK